MGTIMVRLGLLRGIGGEKNEYTIVREGSLFIKFYDRQSLNGCNLTRSTCVCYKVYRSGWW